MATKDQISYESQFKQRIRRDIRQELEEQAIASIPSLTLSNQVKVDEIAEGKFRARVPHYWASIFHDGRGPVRSKEGGPSLLFFRDPDKDPRLAAGYPERYAQVQYLREGKRMDGKKLAAMVKNDEATLTRSVGPAAGTYFFDNNKGFGGFVQRIRDLVVDRFSSFSARWAVDLSGEYRTQLKLK